MKVCVVGAGAIGGLLAVKLALAGETVSVIDRGPHLAAIRSKGLQLHWQDGTISKANVKAFDRAAEAGKQDLVVLGVKAYDLERVAADIEAPARPRHYGDDGAERHPLVVFPERGRQLRRQAPGDPRSERHPLRGISTRTASSAASPILPLPWRRQELSSMSRASAFRWASSTVARPSAPR